MTSEELHSEIDKYFSSHLDNKYWSSLSEDKKNGAIAMAENDVLSQFPCLQLEQLKSSSLIFNAIAEQAVFLARNYENINEGKVVTGESIDGINTSYTLINNCAIAFRAAHFIKEAKRVNRYGSRISRG